MHEKKMPENDICFLLFNGLINWYSSSDTRYKRYKKRNNYDIDYFMANPYDLWSEELWTGKHYTCIYINLDYYCLNNITKTSKYCIVFINSPF